MRTPLEPNHPEFWLPPEFPTKIDADSGATERGYTDQDLGWHESTWS